MKKASIKDVAREAGVSAATVSYVLNNHPRESISPETAARVQAAVTKLDYVPNLNARSLSSRRTHLIGVIIPQTEPGQEFMFSNPFYGDLLSAIEFTARQNGYHILLSGTNSDQSYISIARNRGVDGIIVVGVYPSHSLDELRQIDVPIILIDSYVTDPRFHTIGINDKEGGRLATEYLLSMGHREIAFVSGSIMEYGVNSKRYEGYAQALQAAGLPVNEARLYTGNVDFDYGILAAQQVISRGRQETAAFVTADILALGFVKGLNALQFRVPSDLSVVSFDDVYLARICDPSLTTVRQDIARKGSSAVQIIIDCKDAKSAQKQEIILPIKLVQRASVAFNPGGNRC